LGLHSALYACPPRERLQIKKRVETIGKDENGWRVGTAFGDRVFYKRDWTLRAAAAMAGIYGNDAAEALYPLLATDSEGNKPDCSKTRYTLTFPKGQLPPANAFWSVTMYDGKRNCSSRTRSIATSSTPPCCPT
jgi:hypothetical protein